MRKRCKGKFICRACGSEIIPENFQAEEPEKKPYVRIFGEWKKIAEHEVINYVGFKIEYR